MGSGRGGKRPGSGRKLGVSYLSEEEKGKARCLYLNDDVWDKLGELAKDEGISKSELLRRLILERYLREKGK